MCNNSGSLCDEPKQRGVESVRTQGSGAYQRAPTFSLITYGFAQSLRYKQFDIGNPSTNHSSLKFELGFFVCMVGLL